MGDLLRVVKLRKAVEPFIRNRNNTDIRIDGAEGIIRAFGARLRKCIEKRAFAHVGQSYNT